MRHAARRVSPPLVADGHTIAGESCRGLRIASLEHPVDTTTHSQRRESRVALIDPEVHQGRRAVIVERRLHAFQRSLDAVLA